MINALLNLALKQGWKAATAIIVAVGTVMGSITAIGTARDDTKAAIKKD
jgi:hypothetical protein